MGASAGDAVGLAGRLGTSGAERPPAPRAGSGPETRGPGARDGGRAKRLGPRRPLIRGALAVLAAILIAVAAVLSLSDGRPPHARALATSRAHYGGLPAWLPKPKTQVKRVLQASAGHPALSIEGEAISVSLAAGKVLATAVGPEVPEEGRFPVPPVTPAKFIVTFASASHAIPLAASAFKLIDEQGKAHHPKLTAVGGGTAPTQITPGHSLSVMLHDILPTGDGGLSWTPAGTRPIATWDYTVEID